MNVEPVLGWAALSRAALNRAEAELAPNAEGMRDEVGVLTLHTGYANRFFPGTSVQQTRLRYALFVPWQIKALMADPAASKDPRKALGAAELALAKCLPQEEGEGTIGRIRAHQNKQVSIPPSESYWVALTQWGILAQNPPIELPATRADMFERWSRWPDAGHRQPQEDDEKRPLQNAARLFHAGLPKPPAEFTKGKSIGFILLPKERAFLRTRLLETKRSCDGHPSYLACLVRAGVRVSENQSAWSEALRKHADAADRAALLRARDAASLSVIARAAYYAAVEHGLEHRDGKSPGTKHRDHLATVISQHGKAGAALDLNAVEADGINLGDLREVLAAIQKWAVRGAGAVDGGIIHVLADWEVQRKDSRARLPNSGHGREARAEWNASKAALAVPITYRWSLIARLLADLAE